MTQQISATNFPSSTRLDVAVICAGLTILSLFSQFVSKTHSASDWARRVATEAVVYKSSLQQKATKPEAKESDEISLDYHPWQPYPSTFVVVREDGSVKLIVYDKQDLTVREHHEGVLARADVKELFATARKPPVRQALRLRRRYTRDWGDADLFYLTLRTTSGEQTHWFSMGERAPRTIFFLVDRLLALNNKIKTVSPESFDRYLRAERLTPQDTSNVLQKVRPLEINQFPSGLQEVVGRALAHPNEFFLITAEQASELQKSRTSMLRRAPFVYDLRLFESLLVPKPILIKEPPNEELLHGLSRLHPPDCFNRPE